MQIDNRWGLQFLSLDLSVYSYLMVQGLVGTGQTPRRKESSWNSALMLRAGVCDLWVKNHRHVEMTTEAGTVNPESSEVNILQGREAVHNGL